MQPSPVSSIPESRSIQLAEYTQTLQVLLPGIRENLNQMRQRVEDASLGSVTAETLESLRQNGRQLHDILVFAELAGPAYAMKQALAILDNCHHPDAYTETLGDALAGLLIALPAYIDLMAQGEADSPTLLLFPINALRLAMNRGSISAAEVFAATGGEALVDTLIVETRSQDSAALRALAQRYRPAVMHAILLVLRESSEPRVLIGLARVAEKLEHAATTATVVRSWWILRGLLAAVADGSVPPGTVRLVLLRLERLLGGLADAGETPQQCQLHRQAAAQALYLLGRAPQLTGLPHEVAQAYDLPHRVISPAHQDRLQRALGDAGSQALAGVAASLRDELQVVKESLDVLSRTAQPAPDELKVLVGVTQGICATLAILERPDLMDQMERAVTCLAAWANTGQVVAAQWSEVAQSVLAVEQALTSLAKQPRAMESVAPELQQSVVKEVLVELRHIIETLDCQDSDSAAGELAEPLAQAAAALDLAGLAEAGRCMARLAQALPRLQKGPASAEAVADALQSLVLYLEHGGEASFMDQRALAVIAEQTRRVVDLLPDAVGTVRTDEKPISALTDADADLDLSAIFSEEAAEIMMQIQSALPRWQADVQDREALTALRRAFHTLKGSGRMAGAAAVGELAWSVEHLLNTVLEGSRQADDTLILWVIQAIDLIAEHLQDLQQPLSAAGQRYVGQLAAFINGMAVDLPAAVMKEHDVPPSGSVEPSAVDETAFTQAQPAHAGAADFSLMEAGATPQAGVAVTDVPSDVRPSVEVRILSDVPESSVPQTQSEVDEAVLLAELFEREAAGYLDRVDVYLQQMTHGTSLPLDPDVLRVFHTLKGTARTVERGALADAATELDLWVKAVLSAGKPLSQTQVDLLRQGVATCRRALSVTTEITPDEDWRRRLSADRERLERCASSEPENRIDPSIRAIFLEEAVDLLAHIDALFGDDGNGSEPLPISELMRDLHTFKGGARMSGAQQLGNLAHEIESFLGRLTTDDVIVQPESRLVLRQALDTLQGQLDQWAEGLPTHIPQNLLEKMGGEAEALHGTEIANPQATSPVVSSEPPLRIQSMDAGEAIAVSAGTGGLVQSVGSADPSAPEIGLPDWWSQPLPGASEEVAAAGNEQIRVAGPALDRLLNLIGELIVVNGRIEQPVRELASYAREIARTIDRLRRQLRELELEAESRIVFQHTERAGDAMAGDFDPLEFDRYSRLQQLSRALGESVTDLISLQELVSSQQQTSEAALQSQRRLAGELQGDLLRTRMIPFDFHGARLRRVVRQTAEALDKQAALDITGGETELDRQVLDRMVAPLEHLLRNALAHGIEPFAERVRLGKPAQGRVSLRVSREGSQVLMEIADDGRGLDTATILARARARGLVGSDESLSEAQIFHLILASGLSTAQQVDQIAGRGVGMDVVHSQIKACGGRLEINSLPGRGTTFRIWLPYTLAVSDCLLMQVGSERYAVPMSGIHGVTRLYADQLAQWQQGGLTHVSHLGAEYRLVGLSSLLGMPDKVITELGGEHPVLLVHVAGSHWALVADTLLGTRDIVMRPLGTRVAGIPGIGGATLLSDGGVVLILDLQSLIGTRGRPGTEGGTPVQPAVGTMVARMPRIMVVDDSITVRRVTTRLLEQHGMAAMTARDGVEALQKVQEQMPDLILLDVEMPRMDGFELLANLKSNPALQAIPVVMITSRTGDKHRNRALALGAGAYLGKPYQEADLLETIGELTRDEGVDAAVGMP